MGKLITQRRLAPDYDFQRPNQLSPDALEMARTFAQRWAHRFTSESNTKLNNLTNAVEVTLDSLSSKLYGDWALECPRPAVLNVLEGPAPCLVMVDAALAPLILDHHLSGDGRWIREARELSTIETAIWKQYFANWLDPFNYLWPRELSARWALKSIDFQPAFLNVLQEIDWALVANYTMTLDGYEGRVAWLWELTTFAQVLMQAATRLGPQVQAVGPSGSAIRQQLPDVAIPAQVTLGDLKWSMGLLDTLRPGTIISFNATVDSELPLIVADRVLGYGALGQVRGRYALQLRSIEEREVGTGRPPMAAARPAPTLTPGGLSVDV